MKTILLVDASVETQQTVKAALSPILILCVPSAAEALETIETKSIDLFVLDLNLPDQKSFDFLNRLQGHAKMSMIPVICLSDKNDVNEKISAFELGADDYITKPFHPLELQARVAGRLKKKNRMETQNGMRRVGPFEIDHHQHRVAYRFKGERKEMTLTLTEFKLFTRLALQPGKVCSRQQLLGEAWGDKNNVLVRAVDVHLCALRKKMGPLSNCIRAISGVGYEFRPEIARELHPE